METKVVIDLEMCRVQSNMRRNFYPHKMEIIQIGAVMLNNSYEVLGKFSAFVSPSYGKIDYFIANLTGISTVDVRRAPRLEEALQSMLLWLGDRDVLFYAWSGTDYAQLRTEILAKKLDEEAFACLLDADRWVDYQKRAQTRFAYDKALSLKDALILTDIKPEGRAHDGLADAWNTAKLIRRLELEPEREYPLDRIRKEEPEENRLGFSLGSLLQGLDVAQ